MDWNGVWHVPFFVLKILSQSIFIMSSFVSFPVQTALGVPYALGSSE